MNKYIMLTDLVFLIRGNGTAGDTVTLNRSDAANIIGPIDISTATVNQVIRNDSLVNWDIFAGFGLDLVVTDGGGGDAPAVTLIAKGVFK